MANPSMVIRIAANIAELKKNLAEGKVQIETTTAAMAKMANALSGEKLLQAANNITAAVDKIGGAGKLTRAEMDRVNTTVEKALEKYRALGQEAPAAMLALAEATKKIPPELNNASSAGNTLSGVLGKASGLLSAFGVGLSVGALVSFGKSLLNDADALTKMHDRTGISIEGLQRLQVAGDDAGNTIDEMAGAINQFQNRLVSGDQSAVSALDKLGVSLDDIQRMAPDQQFMAISEALRNVSDPAQQVALAMDLFGKTGTQVLPTLKRGFDDVKDAAVGMSTETAERLDALGDSMQASMRSTKGYAAGMFVSLMDFVASAGNGTIAAAQRDVRETEALILQLQDMAKKATGPKAFNTALPTQFIASETDMARAIEESNKALADNQRAHDKADAAVKSHAAALVTIKGTIDDINQATAKGLWAPKASDMSASLDGYVADLRAAALQVDKIAGIQNGGVAGVWNIGVQLDTKDAQAGLQQLQAQAKTSLGGMLGGIVQGLPGLLQQAFTGGGGIKGFGKAITSQVGEALGGKLFAAGGPMNGISNKLAGVFGDSFGLALPGIGSALGALVGPIMGKLFSVLKGIGGPSKQELEGRTVVADFEKQFGSVETMINRVGDAYRANGKTAEEAQAAIQAMWAAEKLGAEATRLAVAAIAEEIKRQGEMASAISAQGFKSQDELTHAADIANAAYKQMLASGQYTAAQVEQAYRNYQEQLSKLEGTAGEAARAWLEAHKAADGAIVASSTAMQSAEADLKGLIDKRNSLVQGIAAESPEEVMGVIEAQQRGQLAVLDDQIQQKADAYAALADETGQRMADAIVEALRNIKIDPVYVPVVMGNTTLPVIPQADGGDWMVTKPTLFLAGEAGPERATFSPQGKGRGGSSSAAPSMSMGELVAEFAMLRSDLNTRLPVAIGFAVRDQVALLRGRR